MSKEKDLPLRDEEDQLPDVPLNRGEVLPDVRNVMEQLEMTMFKQSNAGLNLSSFSENQKDALIDIISKSEDNGFEYHKQKLKADKEVKLAQISGAQVNHKTLRFAVLGALLVVLTVSLCILIFREKYFITWMAFLTGLVGGSGIPNAIRYLRGPETLASSSTRED